MSSERVPGSSANAPVIASSAAAAASPLDATPPCRVPSHAERASTKPAVAPASACLAALPLRRPAAAQPSPPAAPKSALSTEQIASPRSHPSTASSSSAESDPSLWRHATPPPYLPVPAACAQSILALAQTLPAAAPPPAPPIAGTMHRTRCAHPLPSPPLWHAVLPRRAPTSQTRGAPQSQLPHPVHSLRPALLPHHTPAATAAERSVAVVPVACQ